MQLTCTAPKGRRRLQKSSISLWTFLQSLREECSFLVNLGLDSFYLFCTASLHSSACKTGKHIHLAKAASKQYEKDIALDQIIYIFFINTSHYREGVLCVKSPFQVDFWSIHKIVLSQTRHRSAIVKPVMIFWSDSIGNIQSRGINKVQVCFYCPHCI